MLKLLNGKPVILNENGMFQSGGTLTLSTEPMFAFRSAPAPTPSIVFQPHGTGFFGELRGFEPGMAMTSIVTGTLQGQNIVIYCTADRLAELPEGPVYTVHCQVAKA